MKPFALILVPCVLLLTLAAAPAKAESALAVVRVDSQVAGLNWWNPGVASELQKMLASELRSRGFEVRTVAAELPKGADGSSQLARSTLDKLVRPGEDHLVACTITVFGGEAEGGVISAGGTARVVNTTSGTVDWLKAKASGENRDQVLRKLMADAAAKVQRKLSKD